MIFNPNKIFVIDTNVILYDPKAIFSFQNNNVVIPITLLEEIDKFKKGNEVVNYNAREFIRDLDSLLGDKLLNEPVTLPKKGTISINTSTKIPKEIKKIFWEDSPDHKILAVAYNLSVEYGNRVILVTKDINLRMKAKSLGVKAEDYETGKIKNLDDLYKGKRIIENISSDIIDILYTNKSIEFKKTKLKIKPMPNEYFVLKNNNKSAIAVYDFETKNLNLIEKRKAFGISPKNVEQLFALNALMNPNISLVTLSGKAGTGKTLLALAAALEKRQEYKQILLARPIVPLSNKEIGFLPGDVGSKVNPYMQPLFDNLNVIKNQFEDNSHEVELINKMLENEKLKITALAFIRGRSINKNYFIVDEAQNLTPHEVKTIITRAGEGTKIVLTGDPYQIDTPYLDARSNGLTYIIDKMKGQNIYAHVTLEKGERSYLAELASNLL